MGTPKRPGPEAAPRVLLVEPDPLLAMALEDILLGEGWRVTWWRDQEAGSGPPPDDVDAVVLGPSAADSCVGPAAVDRVWAEGVSRDVPIVGFSGGLSGALRELELALGRPADRRRLAA